MRERLAAVARGIARGALLTESRCAACGAVLGAGRGDLCPACALELSPDAGLRCRGCGEILTVQAGDALLCPGCAQTPRPWGRVLAYGAYQGRLKELLLAYKFEGRLGCGLLLQGLALRAYEAGLPGEAGIPGEAGQNCAAGGYDALTPVPLHPRRLLARGFNQSRELARLIATRHGLPIWDRALLRVRRTTPQMRLARQERAHNIRGAFAAGTEQVSGAALLLVDDIMTTGATLEECARTLLAAGARRVDALVLARA